MSRRYLVCFLLLCAALPAGCRTSVQLADPPMTAPASGVVGNRPPSVKIEGGVGAGDLGRAVEVCGPTSTILTATS